MSTAAPPRPAVPGPHTAASAQRQPLPLFSNYTQMHRRISIRQWRAIRLLVFALGTLVVRDPLLLGTLCC